MGEGGRERRPGKKSLEGWAPLATAVTHVWVEMPLNAEQGARPDVPDHPVGGTAPTSEAPGMPAGNADLWAASNLSMGPGLHGSPRHLEWPLGNQRVGAPASVPDPGWLLRSPDVPAAGLWVPGCTPRGRRAPDPSAVCGWPYVTPAPGGWQLSSPAAHRGELGAFLPSALAGGLGMCDAWPPRGGQRGLPLPSSAPKADR